MAWEEIKPVDQEEDGRKFGVGICAIMGIAIIVTVFLVFNSVSASPICWITNDKFYSIGGVTYQQDTPISCSILEGAQQVPERNCYREVKIGEITSKTTVDCPTK